jgi:hypothetical protein
MWWTKRSWSAEAEEARAKVESQEGSESLSSAEKAKLTRRQALAKFGFQAGAAAVAALTADDLLRKVGTELEKRAGDSQVANAVAKEFKNAGVAFATEAEPSVIAGPCTGCSLDCTTTFGYDCLNCWAICNILGAPTKYLAPANCGSKGPLSCLQCCGEQNDVCVEKCNAVNAACVAKCAAGPAGNSCRATCEAAKVQCTSGSGPSLSSCTQKLNLCNGTCVN